jgi:single-strand DNA-binding protein
VGPDKSVTHFSIAHNTRYKTQDGEQKEEVTFLECDAWGRQGELVSQYLTKGSPVVVEGAIRQDSWTDKEGQKRTRLKVLVNRVHFPPRVGGRGDGPGEEADGMAAGGGAPAPVSASRPTPRPATAARPAAKTAGTSLVDEPPF